MTTSLCANIDTLAMAYLDDELADEELRELELHLRECADCRALVDGERESLAELRRRLAPPPAPDLLRARLRVDLDREDAEAARADRRERVRGWLLPGFATTVAAAALMLFVASKSGMLGDPERADVTAAVVTQQMSRPQVSDTVRPVVGGAIAQASVDKVASWHSELHGRDVVHQLYQVTHSWGGRVVVQVSVFNARGWQIESGEAVRIGGRDLWVVSARGRMAVVHRGPDDLGYVFTSDVGARELLQVIAEHGLIDRVDARLR